MPTCQTCRGEYTEHTWLCPECKAPFVPDTRGGGQVCSQCQQNSFDRRLCPRCQSDVRAREKIRAEGNPIARNPVPYLPTLVALIGTVFQWPPHLLGSILAIALSLIAFFILSDKSPAFWLSGWEGEFKSKSGVSIVAIELGAFLAGLAMALLTIVLIKYWIQPPAAPGFFEKLIVSLTYSLSFVLFTVALTALLVNRQVMKFNRQVPQPVFVDSRRLLELVLDEVAKQLGLKNVPKVSRFERIGDVGIRVFARQRGGAEWEILADKWGRIRSLNPVVEEW